MCKRLINALNASFSKSGLKLLSEFIQHKLIEKWKYALDRFTIGQKPHTQYCEIRMREQMILYMEAVAAAGSEFRHLLFHVIMRWIDHSHPQVLFNTNAALPPNLYIGIKDTWPRLLLYHLFWHCCEQHYHFPVHTVKKVLKQHSLLGEEFETKAITYYTYSCIN